MKNKSTRIFIYTLLIFLTTLLFFWTIMMFSENGQQHLGTRVTNLVPKSQFLNPTPTFTNIQIDRQKETSLLSQYYSLLTAKKLIEAYELYDPTSKTSYETFKSWYKNVESAVSRDYYEIKPHVYEFLVDYKDLGQKPLTYKVRMQVTDNNKLLTLKSEQKIDLTSFGKAKDWVEEDNNFNFVMLENDGNIEIVDMGEAPLKKNDYMGSSFELPTFSQSGRYLMYGIQGWEWYGMGIYDRIGKNKQIFSAAYQKVFSIDEKYLAICGINDLAGDAINGIIKLPEMTSIFELKKINKDFGNYRGLLCSFDKDKNEFIFKLSDLFNWVTPAVQKKELIIKYNLNTNQYREE